MDASATKAPRDDAECSEYSDELLAAIGFVDEFQFALPPSELHEVAAGAAGTSECELKGLYAPAQQRQQHHSDLACAVQDEDEGAVGLAFPSLEELSSDTIADLSSLPGMAESSPSPLSRTREQRGQQQQQAYRNRPTKTTQQTRKQQKKTKKRKPSWDPNKARNERKGEIVYLRKQVTDLEAHLAEMETKKPANSSNRTISIVARLPRRPVSSADGARTSTTTVRQSQGHGVMKARAWEEVAKNQLDMRVKAERENIRLKLVLENQLKIAKSLGNHVDRVTSAQENQRCFPANQIRLMFPAQPRDTASDATAIVESLVAGLEQSYAEVNAVFEANGLADSETSHINTQIHSNSGSATHSLLLEVFATKVLPFDFEATVQAVWDHFEFDKEQTSSRFHYNTKARSESVGSTSSFVKVSAEVIIPVFMRIGESSTKGSFSIASCVNEIYHLQLQAKGTSASFGVKQVIRRYDEQDRVVIVWRSFFDPIESSCDEPLAGVRFLEKGYVVIKQPATNSESFTLLQPCFVITPICSEQQCEGEGNRRHRRHYQSPPTGPMADFVLATTVANIRTSHQMIEDALLLQTTTMMAS